MPYHDYHMLPILVNGYSFLLFSCMVSEKQPYRRKTGRAGLEPASMVLETTMLTITPSSYIALSEGLENPNS